MASQDGLFGRALLCHPVLKFSHSTLPRHATPSAWNHIQGPEIFALIEQLDHDCLQLRVVQGTKDLVRPTERRICTTAHKSIVGGSSTHRHRARD